MAAGLLIAGFLVFAFVRIMRGAKVGVASWQRGG